MAAALGQSEVEVDSDGTDDGSVDNGQVMQAEAEQWVACQLRTFGKWQSGRPGSGGGGVGVCPHRDGAPVQVGFSAVQAVLPSANLFLFPTSRGLTGPLCRVLFSTRFLQGMLPVAAAVVPGLPPRTTPLQWRAIPSRFAVTPATSAALLDITVFTLPGSVQVGVALFRAATGRLDKRAMLLGGTGGAAGQTAGLIALCDGGYGSSGYGSSCESRLPGSEDGGRGDAGVGAERSDSDSAAGHSDDDGDGVLGAKTSWLAAGSTVSLVKREHVLDAWAPVSNDLIVTLTNPVDLVTVSAFCGACIATSLAHGGTARDVKEAVEFVLPTRCTMHEWKRAVWSMVRVAIDVCASFGY